MDGYETSYITNMIYELHIRSYFKMSMTVILFQESVTQSKENGKIFKQHN